MQDKRRKIPSIDRLLKDERLQKYPHKLAKEALEKVTQNWRQKLNSGLIGEVGLEVQIVEDALCILEKRKQNFKKVINATGVVLNTNLGRAPVAPKVIDAIRDISYGYSNLELDLETGNRGERNSLISPLLQELTGVEASIVVNNNAAAVFLILDTFAKNKEVIVSRGELIEIGGEFRLPEVLKKSGVKLVEVGTTNRTYIDDYEQAINENTALLLKTHTSNYKIVGFTHTPSAEEIASLGKKYNLITVEDIGSGLIIDLRDKGLPYEPPVKEAVDSGIEIVSFSGDKLLGGPQAGIILGKKEMIDEMKKNPLFRALRVGKHILAMLEQVIRIYLYDDPLSELPHLSMLTEPISAIKLRAEKLSKALTSIMPKEFSIGVEESVAEIGGGSYPGVEIPSFVVTITPHSAGQTLDEIQCALRTCIPPIIARIADNKVILDARTIFENEIEQIIKGISNNSFLSCIREQ